MFSTNYQYLQNYFNHYDRNQDIHFLSEFLSELCCFLNVKENKEKQHDMLN